MDRTPVLQRAFAAAAILILSACSFANFAEAQTAKSPASSPHGVPFAELISQIRAKAKSLESSSGMKREFETFLTAHKLSPDSMRYSDFVIVRLLFEATRDAGFWNVHWSITDKPPNSDEVWRQWKSIARPSYTEKTATAECDELSALFAFLVERAGVKSVGLFWPYPNHTVAVWIVHPGNSQTIRVVVPTSQIFLTENDTFDTRKFDPWRQKNIYEYTRLDVSDSFEIPKPLFDFFLHQIDKYAGASMDALQQIRNLRDAVLQKSITPEQAAREAFRRSAAYSSSAEDRAAFQYFAEDMRSTK
jgi:hypothetical protein